ncbi:MAG: TolC family protein [Elusimicrobia bacterium]|nr:TolC family protein [Elusimicrobiota bacterium]
MTPAVLALLLCPPVAAAQPVPSIFTAAGYVRAVLDASPEVRQAADLFESARAAWKSQAAAAWLPTLGFTGLTYPYGHDLAQSYRFQRWNLARPDTSLTTSLNWNLFNSMADSYKVRQAALSRDSAEASFSNARQARAFAAAQAFYDLGLKDRLLEVAGESLKIQKDGFDLTRDLYQNGMKSLADLLKSETDWHSSELNLAQAQANRRQSLLQFNLLVGRPADAPAALASELDPGTTALPGLAQDEDAALSRRPEMALARLSVEVRELASTQALRDGAPQLTLDASWNRTDHGSSIGNLSTNPNYQLALGLALPSGFNAASQWFNASAARSQAAAARQSLAATARQVRSEVHAAYIALESALTAYRIAAVTEGIAQRNLELVNEQYKQGSADVIRLAQAQLDYLTSRTRRAQALFCALVSRFQYRLAIGEPLWR